MPGCASEMDQHTPASSGYIRKAPAGNPSSGENSNTRTCCLIAGKTQTHIVFLSPPAPCLSHTHTHDLSTVTPFQLNPNVVIALVAGNEGFRTNTTCRNSSYTHTLVS